MPYAVNEIEEDPVEAFRRWDQAQRNIDSHTKPEYATKAFSGWTEKQFLEFSIKGLLQHFDIDKECSGTCLPFCQVKPKAVRVDLICRPKKAAAWGLGAFAIEYKRPDRPATVKLGDHIAQALDYRNTYFHGYGYLPVFLCPGLQGYANPGLAEPATYDQSNNCIHYSSARRILGGLGIGEMFLAKDGAVSLFLAAEPLLVRGRLLRNAAVQRKVGRGVASMLA